MERFEVLSILGKDTFLRAHGKRLYTMLRSSFEKRTPLIVDLAGLERLGIPFLDEAFGRLAHEFGAEAFGSLVHLENVDVADREVIDQITARRAADHGGEFVQPIRFRRPRREKIDSSRQR